MLTLCQIEKQYVFKVTPLKIFTDYKSGKQALPPSSDQTENHGTTGNQ